MIFIGWYWWFFDFHLKGWLWISSLLFMIIVVSGLALGLGLIISVITAKYRDLGNMVQLAVRLLMFATPIFYPLSLISKDAQMVVRLDPLASIIEFIRLGFFGSGTVSSMQLVYSFVLMCLIFPIGVLLFNKFGSKLLDVV